MSAFAPRRRPAAVLALAVVALALLAGCTAADQTDDATPTPTQAPAADTAETGTCTDGYMLVDMDATDPDADAGAGAPVAVSDADCDLVSVVGSGGTVELGTVGTLVVEGTSVAVTVAEVTTVRLAGDENTVTHGGAAPATEDAGVGNSVVPAA